MDAQGVDEQTLSIRIEHLTDLLVEAHEKLKAKEKELRVMRSFTASSSFDASEMAGPNTVELHNLVTVRTKKVIELTKETERLGAENERLCEENMRLQHSLMIMRAENESLKSRLAYSMQVVGSLENENEKETKPTREASPARNSSNGAVIQEEEKPQKTVYRSPSKSIVVVVSPTKKTGTHWRQEEAKEEESIPTKEDSLSTVRSTLSCVEREKERFKVAQKERQSIEKQIRSRYGLWS